MNLVQEKQVLGPPADGPSLRRNTRRPEGQEAHGDPQSQWASGSDLSTVQALILLSVNQCRQLFPRLLSWLLPLATVFLLGWPKSSITSYGKT